MNKLFSLIFVAVLAIFTGYNTTFAADTIGSCNSAVLKGRVTVERNNPTTVWFEWGRGSRESRSSYPNVTYSQTLYRSGSFEEMIEGLTPSTTYYYRAIAQNNDGTTVGDLETFRTSECETKTITRTVVKYVPVPSPAPAPRPTARVYPTPTVAYTPANFQNGAQNYQPSLSANVLDSQISYNLFQIVFFLIFILLVVLIVKRIFSRPMH